MINFRYHIVSLMAVFLALGLGVVVGTIAADEGVVKFLNRQTRALREQRDVAREERVQAERELRAWESYGAAAIPPLMRGALRDQPVLLMIGHDTADELLEDLDASLAAAGATPAGRIRFSAKWPLIEDVTRRELAAAIGSSATDTRGLLAEAAKDLAARLRAPADPEDEDDLIAALSRAGFLSLEGTTGGSFPPAGTALVFVSAGTDAPSPADTTFTMPFLRALSGPVGVAEPLGSDPSMADRVRADRALAARIATVDHVDTLPGRYALVAALRDVVRGGAAAHYGIRPRAAQVAPSS